MLTTGDTLTLNKSGLALHLFTSQGRDKSRLCQRTHNWSVGSSSQGEPIWSPGCLWTAHSTVSIPLHPGSVPKTHAATPKGPWEGDLCQRKLWAPGTDVTAEGERCDCSHWGPACTQCHPSPDTAFALQKAAQLITYRAQVQRFPSFSLFLLTIPQSQKHSASIFTCCAPVNAINKRSRALCTWVLSLEPCRAPQSQEPSILNGPWDSLRPPCYPPARGLTSLIEYTITENNTFILSNIPYNWMDQNEHASQTVYFRQETAPQTIITN